jgi:ER membrane protein complex subunit 7
LPCLVKCQDNAVSAQTELFTIVGKVTNRLDELDLENTRIIVDDGKYVGFLRNDGTFSISGLPSNSYVVEVSSPRNVYEPVRVDINSKGKVRVRRLNLLQPSDVTVLRYPINFESKGYPNYFHKREQFRVMDILMSPMVLMMGLPLLLVLVLPKLINQDPELQRELQQTTSMLQPSQQNLPNISDLMNSFLPNDKPKPKPSATTKSSTKSKK